MKGSALVWMLGAVTARALASVAQKPYAMNSGTAASAVIPPPHASGARSSSTPCDSLTKSSAWPTASAVPYPIASLPASSFITPTASLVSASVSDVLTTQPMAIMSTLSSSADPAPALQPVNSPHIADKAVAIAALPASSSIDLELLSSILLSGLPDAYTKTATEKTTVIVSLSLPIPLSTPLSDSVSSSSVAPTVTTTVSPSSETSATEFPTSPPFLYNPSASRGSATPISRPTPDSSSANVVGSTLSTSSAPSATGNMEIPPAPSAAGASSNLGGRGKEKVWWVAFLVPFLLGA